MPRENGSQALERAMSFVAERLSAAGLGVETLTFPAHPFVLRLAGVLVLVGVILYWRFVRQGRALRALAVALALPGLLWLELEGPAPLLSRLPGATQQQVVARIDAASPERTLIFSAHLDTKTDWIDPGQRTPIELLAVPIASTLIAGAIALLAAARAGQPAAFLRRLALAAGVLGIVYGIAVFVALSGGAFARERSRGALDDGGACAVLVRLAERIAAGPRLARTDVVFVFFSGEEIGSQGSRAFVSARGDALRTGPSPALLNLEGVGVSPDLAALGAERAMLSIRRPDAGLLADVDRAHRATRGRPLAVLPLGGATDARFFLAAGIPALTLTDAAAAGDALRGVHTARDVRDRLDPAALDAALETLEAVIRAADAAAAPAVR